MSKFRIKPKSRVNWSYDKFYMMIRGSYINCKIELIENFPCNHANELICKENEVFDKLINETKIFQIKIYIFSSKKNFKYIIIVKIYNNVSLDLYIHVCFIYI